MKDLTMVRRTYDGADGRSSAPWALAPAGSGPAEGIPSGRTPRRVLFALVLLVMGRCSAFAAQLPPGYTAFCGENHTCAVPYPGTVIYGAADAVCEGGATAGTGMCTGGSVVLGTYRVGDMVTCQTTQDPAQGLTKFCGVTSPASAASGAGTAGTVTVDLGPLDAADSLGVWLWCFSGVIFCYCTAWGVGTVLSMLDSRANH